MAYLEHRTEDGEIHVRRTEHDYTHVVTNTDDAGRVLILSWHKSLRAAMRKRRAMYGDYVEPVNHGTRRES